MPCKVPSLQKKHTTKATELNVNKQTTFVVILTTSDRWWYTR